MLGVSGRDHMYFSGSLLGGHLLSDAPKIHMKAHKPDHTMPIINVPCNLVVQNIPSRASHWTKTARCII